MPQNPPNSPLQPDSGTANSLALPGSLTLMLRERRVVGTLLGVAAVLILTGLLCVVARATPAFVGRDGFIGLFDLGGTGGLARAFSVLMLLGTALTLGMIAWVRGRTRIVDAFSWKVLAFIAGGLTLNRATLLHGRLTDLVQVDGALPYTWVLVNGTLILVAMFAFLQALDHLPRPVRWPMLGAGVLYLCGELGLEGIAGLVTTPPPAGSLLDQLMTVGNSGLRMLGVIVFIGALIRFLRLYLPELVLPLSLGPGDAER